MCTVLECSTSAISSNGLLFGASCKTEHHLQSFLPSFSQCNSLKSFCTFSLVLPATGGRLLLACIYIHGWPPPAMKINAAASNQADFSTFQKTPLGGSSKQQRVLQEICLSSYPSDCTFKLNIQHNQANFMVRKSRLVMSLVFRNPLTIILSSPFSTVSIFFDIQL